MRLSPILGVVAGLLCALPAPLCVAQKLHGPAKVYRTLSTDIFEVWIQKNGRTDIVHLDGSAIFDNACPMIQFADEEEAEQLPVDGRYTSRAEVDDALGEGNALIFSKKDCEWHIRVYPGKPFFTAQVVYVNNKSKPIRVARLIPWAAGGARAGGLVAGRGASEAAILEYRSGLWGGEAGSRLVRGGAESDSTVAVFNPAAGRVFVAGFLSGEHAVARLVVQRSAKAPDDMFDIFRAECIYDPPVEVPPGGKLMSEVLYLAPGEADVFTGLERCAAATAARNHIRVEPRFIPHGSEVRNVNVSEASVLQELEVVDRDLKRYGWRHVEVAGESGQSVNEWEKDSRFPHGMKWLVDQIHARGMTAGLAVDFCTVDRGNPVVSEHPEWIFATTDTGNDANGRLALNMAAPGVYEHVRGLAAKVGQEWGFDAVRVTDAASFFGGEMQTGTLTRMDVFRMGLAAVREGLGEDKFVANTLVTPVHALYANLLSPHRACVSTWGKSGCVDWLTDAARRYSNWPFLCLPDPGCVELCSGAAPADQPPLTRAQRITWLTGAALTGGVVRIGDRFSDLAAEDKAVLSRLLPTPERAARPVDLFEADLPRIWALPVDCAIGKWTVAAVFNWDEAGATIPVEFTKLGLEARRYYTVYDFWEGKYFGSAIDRLQVGVPPASMRLLCLRPYEDRPQFLATDRHFTAGATDHTVLEWDAAARTLSGVFTGVADTDYTLRVLVPEPYAVQEVAVSTGAVEQRMDEHVLVFSCHCAGAGPVTWSVRF